MAIVKEFYLQRKDGVKIYRTYSNNNVYIKQLNNGVETGLEDTQAFDVENAPFTYLETDKPIEEEA